jgi:hypothetical protein
MQSFSQHEISHLTQTQPLTAADPTPVKTDVYVPVQRLIGALVVAQASRDEVMSWLCGGVCEVHAAHAATEKGPTHNATDEDRALTPQEWLRAHPVQRPDVPPAGQCASLFLVLGMYDDRRTGETSEVINAVLDDVTSYEAAKDTALSVAGAVEALDELESLAGFVPQACRVLGAQKASGGEVATAEVRRTEPCEASVLERVGFVAPPKKALEYAVYAQLRASDASIVLYELVSKIASDVSKSLVVLPGGVKKLPRTIFKSAVKYNCDISKISDLVRCTVLAETLADVAAVFHAFLQNDQTTVVQVKNRFAPDYPSTLVGGYLDVQLKVRFQSGGAMADGEVQINLWSVLRIKEALRGGHAIFNFVRSLRAYDPAMYTYHGEPTRNVCARIAAGEIMVANLSGSGANSADRTSGMEVVRSVKSKRCCLVLLDLSHCSLSSDAFRLLTEAVETSYTLTTLKLNDISLGCAGGEALGAALACNKSLKVLELERTDLANEGVAAVASGLTQNDTVLRLCLGDVSVSASTWAIAADAIKRKPGRKIHCPDLDIWALGDSRSQTTCLDLSGVLLGSQRTQIVSRMVAASTTLQTVVLRRCDLGDDGVEILCEALDTNTSVTTVDLSSNSISDTGARGLATTLRRSNTLLKAVVLCNDFGTVGVIAFARASATRTRLHVNFRCQIEQSKVLMALSDSELSAQDKKLVLTLNEKTELAQKWAEGVDADPHKGVHLTFQRGVGTYRSGSARGRRRKVTRDSR